MNRVSKEVVMSVLKNHMSEKDAWKLFDEIVDADKKVCDLELGMTYGEWKKHFDDECSVVWAANSGAGFGNAGDTVYGDCDDMVIVKVSECLGHKTLYLWYDVASLKDVETLYYIVNLEDARDWVISARSTKDAVAKANELGVSKVGVYRFDTVSGGDKHYSLCGRYGE